MAIFYWHTEKMMKHEVIFSLSRFSFSSTFDGWFCQWYHFSENSIVSNIVVILFYYPFSLYAIAAIHIWASIYSQFSGGCVYKACIFKPLFWHLQITKLKNCKLLLFCLTCSLAHYLTTKINIPPKPLVFGLTSFKA